MITSLNLLSGVLSLVCSLYLGEQNMAVALIIAAAIFDFLDGLVARLLHATSPIGKELDSLADVVSFGAAPAGLIFGAWIPEPGTGDVIMVLPIFLTSVFAGIRLAKFNVDTRQTTSFIGLPVPSNALFWIGFYALGMRYDGFTTPDIHCVMLWTMWVMSVVISGLMVSEIPMFSLKVHDLKWHGNEWRYMLLAASIILLIVLRWGAMAPIIGLYLILSLLARQKGFGDNMHTKK